MNETPDERLRNLVNIMQRHIDAAELLGLDTLAGNLTALQMELATIAGDMRREREKPSDASKVGR